MSSLRLFSAAVVIGLAGACEPLAAETISYQCAIKGAKPNDWIQPLIFIAHDTDSGRIVASDAVVLGFNDGQPVDARLVTENAARITFAWAVDVVLRVSPIEMGYRATILKPSNEISVLAQPRGYENNYTARGTCEVKPLGE